MSWDTVTCHAMGGNKKHLVQQLAVRRAGAPVDGKMMVEAACHKLHEGRSGNQPSDMLSYKAAKASPLTC